MSQQAALVGERAPEMCRLISSSLRGVGYSVEEAATPQQLVARVCEPGLLTAQTALVVVSARWCQEFAESLSAAAAQRSQLLLPELKLVLVHEWGTLGLLSQPSLPHCALMAALEKPFELRDLEELAKLALARVA